MNGYFNNLALRTMNAGNLVEPRLPSLFEPQRGELEAAAPPVVHSEPRPPAPIDASVSIEESTAAEEVILREQPAVHTARSSSKPTHEDQTESPAVVTEAPLVEAPSATKPPPPPPPQAAPQTKTPIAPKSEIKSVQSVSPQPARTERTIVTKVTAESFPAPQSRIETQTTSAVEETVSIVEEQEQEVYFESPPPTLKTQALSRPEVQPELVERLIERSRNTDKTDFRSVTRSITNYAWRESEAPEPEPTINVTIGRVEVRAAPATNTKPARTRQESPVMPLDEYLRKQRRGGER